MDASQIKHNSPGYILVGKILNVIVLLSSVLILGILSLEILQGATSMPKSLYMNAIFFICLIFLVDYFYLFFLAKDKWKYFINHLLFLLVSIPYANIINWLDIQITPTQSIMLKAILLIRGGYGLVIMINWFTKSKVTNMLISYIVILLAMSYFGSLVFFSLEMGKNPGLHHFGDAIWWACMDVTTVGCAIEPVTGEGRVLAVILAVMGMSMFPILTVYITNYFQNTIGK